MAEVLIRTYPGRNQMQAVGLYGDDALKLAEEGWVPVSEVWVADEWSFAAVALAAILVLVGIGIIMLAVMAVIKPTRTLLVTYHREAAAAV